MNHFYTGFQIWKTLQNLFPHSPFEMWTENLGMDAEINKKEHIPVSSLIIKIDNREVVITPREHQSYENIENLETVWRMGGRGMSTHTQSETYWDLDPRIHQNALCDKVLQYVISRDLEAHSRILNKSLNDLLSEMEDQSISEWTL